MSKNFINFHILISHSPSCLNRDDMNMQKSAIFGGKRRVRISSQSLKQAMRSSEYYSKNFPAKSIRTRKLELLTDKFCEEFTKLGYEIEKQWIEKGIQVFSGQVISSDKESDDDIGNERTDQEESKEKTKKVAVAPWTVSEFKFICDKVMQVYKTDLTEKENEALQKAIDAENKRKLTKANPERKSLEQIKEDFLTKKVKKELEDNTSALMKACGQATDIALSGRMATSGLMSNIDGAMAIAHVITTHTVDADIDWFTAVDDLQAQGSGHLDTQEFSSGVFYRYASLNIKQLQENLGDVNREEALKVAKHILHLLATIVPSAKQQSHAAYNLADLALVSFSDLPISLANAFETPIRAAQNGGFLQPSIKELLAYWQKANHKYSLEESVALFSLRDTETPENVKQLDTLENLKAWIANDTQEN